MKTKCKMDKELFDKCITDCLIDKRNMERDYCGDFYETKKENK